MTRNVNLALQGGGAHGAFAWGVLDRLLEGDEIAIAAISGTSAGALNGAALRAGLATAPGRPGREAARANLRHVWSEVARYSDNSMVRWMTSFLPVPTRMQRLAEMMSPMAWLEGVTRVFSPYDYGPFYHNPLGPIIRQMPHPRLDTDAGPRLFVTATNVRTGRVRIFSGAEVTADAVMASACLPTLFRAVEITDPATGRREAFWDGGYSGNPAIFPLFGADLPRDVIVIAVNPMERDHLPRSPVEIQDRINEISFNSSLLRELRAIQFVKRLSSEGRLTGRNMKEPLLHMIFDDELMTSLGSRSKVMPAPGLVAQMFDAGRSAAQGFVDAHLDHIGARDTVDLPPLYG